MKTKQLAIIIAGAALCVGLHSCVSKGKYLMSESHNKNLQNDSSQTHSLLDQCNGQVTNLTSERDKLRSNYEGAQKDLQGLQDVNSNLQDQNSKTNADLNQSKMTIADQAKRLRDLQALIQSQKDATNRLKKTIADALVNFKADELNVSVKDGKVYVSLSEKLLFKSGSAVVDPKGKEALGTLAKVLNTTKDVSVMIEGHTDTVPIKTAQFVDNWALSAGRAASIVRILTKEYDVDPHTVTAAGRGEFHPVGSNATPEGKALNRRTEIIISPNLNELYRLIGE